MIDDSRPQPDGSRDGQGAGDNDQPYRFGRRPHARAPFPFTDRQYARLLVLRARLGDRNALLDRRMDDTAEEAA